MLPFLMDGNMSFKQSIAMIVFFWGVSFNASALYRVDSGYLFGVTTSCPVSVGAVVDSSNFIGCSFTWVGKDAGTVNKVSVHRGELRFHSNSHVSNIYKVTWLHNCPAGQELVGGVCTAPPECNTDLIESQARWDEALYGNSPVYCINSCEGKRKGGVICPSGTCFGDIYGTGNSCEGSGIIDSEGGDTGGSEGGDTGGSEGGDTGGSTGGDTGGSTGGDTGGSTGGNTGGSTGGNTGGSTGGNTGGGSSGSGQAAFDDSAILNRIDSLKSATTGAIDSVKGSVDGVATGVQGINDKLDNLLGNDRKFTQPQQSGWMNSIMQKPIENLQASTEQLKDELEEKLQQSPLKLGTMDFNNGDYTGTSFALTRSGWSVDVDFNLFGILGSNTELIRNVIIFAAALMAAFIILSSGRKN